MITWDGEEHFLQINVILIQKIVFNFTMDLDKVGMFYNENLSAVCTFSWNHETNGMNQVVKIL